MDIQEMITGHWLCGPRVEESALGTSSKQGQKAKGEGQATEEDMPRSQEASESRSVRATTQEPIPDCSNSIHSRQKVEAAPELNKRATSTHWNIIQLRKGTKH